MRKKNGKRIGPVPIALVAVLALAALVSAGLWLAPNQQAQAQAEAGTETVVLTAAAGTTIGDMKDSRMIINDGADVEMDVGEDIRISVAETFAAANDTSEYVVVWKDATDDPPVNITDNFSGVGVAVTTVTNNEIALAPPDDALRQGGGDAATAAAITRTATVKISARPSAATSAVETFEFDVVLVENPIEQDGVKIINPDGDEAEGVQFPDGACEIYKPAGEDFLQTRREDPAVSNSNRINLGTPATAILVSGGDCLTSEDEVEVSFTNATAPAANAELELLVYVTGGDDLNDVEPALAEDGLDEHFISVPAARAGDPGEETITVTRSMADGSGIVYLIGYRGHLAADNLGDKDTTFGTDADFAIKVVFQDPPSDADDDAGDPLSLITVVEVPRGTATATPKITVRDDNGHPVSGFVNLTIEGGSSVLFTDSSLKTHRAPLKSDGTVDVGVKGLPKTGPFKIKITAEIGGITLTKNIVRKGDAATVEAVAYICVEDSRDEVTDHDTNPQTASIVARDDVCSAEIAAANDDRSGNDPDEVVALGPDDAFFISAKAIDTAENVVEKEGLLHWSVTKNTDNEDDAKKAIDGSDQGRTDRPIYIGDGDDAIAGTYSITVDSDDGEASTMIEIVVSGDASMIDVTCDPVMVPTDTGQTDCVVMVTDANGNIPSNLMEEEVDNKKVPDTIQVTVRSRDAQIIGVDEKNRTNIDEEGMATFSILLREDAVEGSSITVNVSTSEIGDATLRESVTVMYGEAMPEPMPMPMLLGDPSITSVMSDAAGMATIMLMPGDNADQHWIWGTAHWTSSVRGCSPTESPATPPPSPCLA